MKIGAIIQARMSSTRLPGKVLKQLPYNSGITVLEQVINRLSASKKTDQIIVATSTNTEDDPIEETAEKKGVSCFRGSLNNVLERFYLTAKEFKLDHIVRITADCPCIDPNVTDLVISEHLSKHADYTNISLKKTFPHGLDTAVIRFSTLEEAYKNAKFDYEKQHVTSYFYKTNPQQFNIHTVEAEKNLNRPDIRLTIDTAEDYALMCCIYENLYKEEKIFSIEEIITLVENKPWLLSINGAVKQKNVHKDLNSEIEEVISYCKTQDLNLVKELLINFKRE